MTVDRYGSSDSPPHAELVCSALCRENEIAEGVSSAALTVEINDEQLLMDPHLRCRQTDALSGVHAAQHVAG